MGRAPCCDKNNVKRGPWSPDEDSLLRNYLEKNGTAGNWISLPQRAGLKRCGKSCRLRWLNYLRPDIKHGAFTEEEDHTIISMYYKIGSRWSVIANNLQGRTDNDVKNHWNTKLKKKLFSDSIDNKNIKFNPRINPKIINNNLTFTNNNIIYPIAFSNFNNNTNQVHNHQIHVPTPSFSDLLTNGTTSTTFVTLESCIGRDPFSIPISNLYPSYKDLITSQAGSPITSVDNVKVCPHEDQVSSASGSSSVVYGSSFQDDPFLAELGFGLMEDDIKPPGLGQGVANY